MLDPAIEANSSAAYPITLFILYDDPGLFV